LIPACLFTLRFDHCPLFVVCVVFFFLRSSRRNFFNGFFWVIFLEQFFFFLNRGMIPSKWPYYLFLKFRDDGDFSRLNWTLSSNEADLRVFRTLFCGFFHRFFFSSPVLCFWKLHSAPLCPAFEIVPFFFPFVIHTPRDLFFPFSRRQPLVPPLG